MSRKIGAGELMACFETMLRERWRYDWGAARKGCVDCSGAFVYAYRVLGGPAIEHGSNAIARRHTGTMRAAKQAKPGWAAFKWKESGEPARYADGRGNYYHIGLVDKTGRFVLNAKDAKSGFSRDAIDGWDFAAPLDGVSYEEVKGMVLYRARVTTQSGPLNLRDRPEGTIIGRIPRAETVDVLSDDGEWYVVDYQGAGGYVSSAYLERIEERGQGMHIVLEDGEGNTFYPVGGWTVRICDADD